MANSHGRLVGCLSYRVLPLSRISVTKPIYLSNYRQQHHWLHNGLLPHPPLKVRSEDTQYRNGRRDKDSWCRLWKGRRIPRVLGILKLHRAAELQPARTASEGTCRRAAMAIPARSMLAIDYDGKGTTEERGRRGEAGLDKGRDRTWILPEKREATLKRS
jgi:hypothetical protein